jgi:shikimate dehydrogenase
LRERFGTQIATADWAERDASLTDASLLVNATTLGMHGQPDLAIDIGRLPAAAIVADLVYVPLDTPLLRAARARGLRTADGIGMLLHQAVRGFLQWFGKKPEITNELKDLLERNLSGSPPRVQE